MTREYFILGIACWLLVALNFAVGFIYRRTALRLLFALMPLGCALALAREVKLVPLKWAVPLHLALVMAGVLAATLLVLKLMQNPRSLR